MAATALSTVANRRAKHSGCVVALCLLAVSAAQADPLSFDAAWEILNSRSDRLAGDRAALRSKELQTQGLKGLGGPSVSMFASSLAYNANLNVNLDPLQQKLLQFEQLLPLLGLQLPSPSPIPALPASYTFNQHDTLTTASLSGVWPLYTGGAADATRGFVRGQEAEARADADNSSHELSTLLVQRYFGAQLAMKAAHLGQAALQAIEQHDASAERNLAAGLISRIERLQARVALIEAQRSAGKAEDDAELATTTLAHTLHQPAPVTPVTPLFVFSHSIAPLAVFLRAAQERHPGLAKVAAKQQQAEELHLGQEALRKPQVFAFGQRQIKAGNADWMVGVGARWTLFDSVDRNALGGATQKLVDQASLAMSQARSDIALLVEKNWRAVEQGRRQFLAMRPMLQLAGEMREVRKAALQAGTGTALEGMDAEVNQARAQTQSAQSAYDYVLALAQLLQSCGLSEQFGSYSARADIRLE
jgi:outer membrane protein TolC